MAKTIQTNARANTNTFKNAKLFRGIHRTDGVHARNNDQFITGYGRFIWLSMPKFCEELIPEKTEAFKNYVEVGFKSFDGINDITMDTVDMEGGFAGNKITNPSNAKDDFDTFTLKIYEQLGSPVREFIDFWFTGIRDFKTGLAHYHGAELPYSVENHTASGIYIVTDPSGLSSGLEYAAYISHIFPKKIPKSHLNFAAGSHDAVEMDLEFAGHKQEGPDINAKAKLILDTIQETRNYYDGEYESITV
jgi:hypothetical protein